ncbi:MAG: DUF3570 domain-containing protein [Opitutaceae bacterium]|nr:DUF3570 domain-containing protein [Opitutaceae bacterium]
MKTPAPRTWRQPLLLLLALLVPRAARPDHIVAVKHAEYRESGGRVVVQTQSALLESELGTAWRAKVTGTLDAIAGATPNGQPAPAGSSQVPLSTLHDRRKAWTADLARQFQRVNLTAGFGNSRESDYVSNGWSLNAVMDFNQKNTTLLTGVAGAHDEVKVLFQPERIRKRTNDLIAGVTQLLDRRTSVTCNVSWGRATGYLSDPYKLVQKEIEILPEIFLTRTFRENRPAERTKGIGLVALNRSFAELNGAVDATYRFYRDSFGVTAHTFDVAWLQRLGRHVIVSPAVRLYQQSAADFYVYDLNRTTINPVRSPDASTPFYSSDFRLSALRTSNLALKVIWSPAAWLQLDAAVEHYVMRGRDGVTPASAYVRATTFTVGARLSR